MHSAMTGRLGGPRNYVECGGHTNHFLVFVLGFMICSAMVSSVVSIIVFRYLQTWSEGLLDTYELCYTVSAVELVPRQMLTSAPACETSSHRVSLWSTGGVVGDRHTTRGRAADRRKGSDLAAHRGRRQSHPLVRPFPPPTD